MPFTLSHGAAALPFRRTRLVPSALLIGTFAPDLEYFIRLQPGGGWGHTLRGALFMSLPLGLAALWVFHRLVKVPLVYLLPDRVRARLTEQLLPFRFGPPLRFLLIVLSIVVGIATHLLWDGFTHARYWPARRLPMLMRASHLPGIGWVPRFEMLQLGSSALGLALLALWCIYWYRRKAPDPQMPANLFSRRQRNIIGIVGSLGALVAAVARAYIGIGIPRDTDAGGEFVDQAVVTFGTIVWWQLAMWGLVGPFRRSHRIGSEEETYTHLRNRSRTSLER